MTRRAFMTLPAALVTSKAVTAQSGFHLTGIIDGEHVEGGYFHIGKEFVMATPIRSPLYAQLTKLVGTEVELTIHPLHG